VTAHHCFDDMTVAMAKMPAAEIVDLCMEQRPHVVLLGAGASHAAFSDGDADGRSGPVMNELVSFNGVGELLRQAGLEGIDRNFEELYAELRQAAQYQKTADLVENEVRRFFVEMRLPNWPPRTLTPKQVRDCHFQLGPNFG